MTDNLCRNKLRRIMDKTSKLLCELYDSKNFLNYEAGIDENKLNTNRERPLYLIFPPNRTKNEQNKTKESSYFLRVSEQEARFCMTNVIENDKSFLYSVETPTVERYCFKKSTGDPVRKIRAQSDVSLWDFDGKQLFNIELKAKNPALDTYKKDFEKLLSEKAEGVWFQVLESADEGTFKSLKKKILSAIKAQDKYKTNNSIIHFVFCVLGGKYHGKISFGTLELFKENGDIITNETTLDFLEERFDEIR